MYVHRQDPNEIVKYMVDWAAISPATVASATWVGAVGLTQSGVGNDTRYHWLKVAAPTVGTTHSVTSRVTASDGQVYDYTFLIVGKES